MSKYYIQFTIIWMINIGKSIESDNKTSVRYKRYASIDIKQDIKLPFILSLVDTEIFRVQSLAFFKTAVV